MQTDPSRCLNGHSLRHSRLRAYAAAFRTGPSVGTVKASFLVRSSLAHALIGLALCISFSGVAFSQDGSVWPVRGRLLGEDGSKSKDMSGIACAAQTGFPRSCLVIDDELQSAQFVTVDDGSIRAGETVDLIENRFNGKALELDGEGVAYAEGSFYVIGSHGHPRDRAKKLEPNVDGPEIAAKIGANSQVIRIRMKSAGDVSLGPGDIADVRASSKLRDFIAADPVLSRFMDRRLENNGVDIEGIAIVGARLFAGFRGPSIDGSRAPVLSVPLDALFEPASPREISRQAQLHLLPLGDGLGVRDLAPHGDGILVLGGPTAGGRGGYGIYWWDAVSEVVRLLADISKFAVDGRKPEAILPLDVDASGLRILIISDGKNEGKPFTIVVPLL